MGRAQVFGSYQLVERIGVGAMGEVYRAIQRSSGRVVTLKRLMASASGNAEAIASLRQEATLLRALDHPGIAKVVDVGEAEGVHYIAYEFVPGRDLRAIQDRARRGLDSPSSRRTPVSRPGVDLPASRRTPASRPGLDGPPSSARSLDAPAAPLPLDVAVLVALRVAEALAHAHERTDANGKPLALVHRDVSPPNVLVSLDGSVKLLDFGIARAAGLLVRTDAGQVRGTIGYMSPEQVRGVAVDARSDLYSLGVCLWEMCTGRRLFDALLPHEVARRILSGDIPAPCAAGASISPGLEAVILKALAQSPEGRYPTAAELHAALSRQAGADGLLTDPVRVARYVRSLFPEVAAEEAASREESLDMADNKGGSDLDVFEGLAKKSARPASPGLTPPPASQARKATLLGGMAPLPPPSAPPASKSAPPPPAPLPPPPSKAPSLPPPITPPPKASGTLPGLAAPPAPLPPPPASMKAPLPPPPSQVAPPAPPAPPPPPTPSAAAPPPLPAPAPPPREKTGSVPTSALVPPPFAPAPSAAAAPLPPPAPPPNKAAPPAPLPPPAPPKEKAAGKAAVDMDWDDEEESTHVYDKAEHGALPVPTKPPVKVAAAAALLASSGGAAPAVKAPSVAPPAVAPAMPAVPAPPPIPAEPRRDEPTAIRPRPVVAQPTQGGGRLGVILGGISLVVVLALAVFILLPKKGQFKVNVSSKTGAPVGAVDIYVDGQKKCEATPCVISELEPGTKTIKVIAHGFPPAEASDTVEAGKEKVVFVTLEAGGAAAPGPAPVANTGNGAGLKIAGTDGEKNVRVLVDGADKGTLPVDLKDLTPGSHKVRFEGGERYEKLEQTVDLTAGQTKDLGEIKLKVLKGQVTLDIATQGVAVTLVKRGDKKVEKKLTDAMLKNPPVKLDIDPSENWRLVATKKGFDEFTQDLTFEDGQAEKTIKVELVETGKTAAVAPANNNPGNNTAPPPKDNTPPAKTADPPPASGSGTLNINSIPVSKVILDGKPLGSTPKVGVSVPAGSHTVTFIHPDQGKKSVTVQVKAGETKTAAVKF